jgi:hypothetical protein
LFYLLSRIKLADPHPNKHYLCVVSERGTIKISEVVDI